MAVWSFLMSVNERVFGCSATFFLLGVAFLVTTLSGHYISKVRVWGFWRRGVVLGVG